MDEIIYITRDGKRIVASGADLEQILLDRANAVLFNEKKAEQDAAQAAKKAAAEAKLAALGLTADDLKALGLGGN